MKKFLTLICGMLIPCMALAEGAIDMPADFLTWEDIGTLCRRCRPDGVHRSSVKTADR